MLVEDLNPPPKCKFLTSILSVRDLSRDRPLPASRFVRDFNRDAANGTTNKKLMHVGLEPLTSFFGSCMICSLTARTTRSFPYLIIVLILNYQQSAVKFYCLYGVRSAYGLSQSETAGTLERQPGGAGDATREARKRRTQFGYRLAQA